MSSFDRRSFLASISCSLAGAVIPAKIVNAESFRASTAGCWLEVAAPFVVVDKELGVECDLVLTSDTFAGIAGHTDGKFSTDYEICLYDASGRIFGSSDGITKRMTVPAMRTTVIPIRELIGEAKQFFGGLKVRLRPAVSAATETAMPHASDLFSSAFIRWRTGQAFDNVHANPDPLQWQNTDSYFYSMPFPGGYENVFSLFNPNNDRSAGEINVFDSLGKRFASQRYDLKPHASLLFDLQSGKTISAPWSSEKTASSDRNGLIAVVNDQGTAKSFGYLMIRRSAQHRFSVEHPIHQSVFKQKSAAAPFDDKNQFKAKNVLYTPLLFHHKKIGGLTFDSRFYLGAGLPLEESLWLYPFAVDGKGEVIWSAMEDKKLASALPQQTERGVIRLGANQSCALDFNRLSISPDFTAGGLGVAVSPDTNHTLMKVEVRVAEWDAYAFTHFRPGLRSARLYQKPKERGGLATDYIASGARVVKTKTAIRFDELIGVINIDDQGLEANPSLELFSSRGLVTRISLGTIPPFACRHFLISDLLAGEVSYEPLSLRLTDGRATLLMSVLHIDHERRDIALDHGSDRFSTFLDFVCP